MGWLLHIDAHHTQHQYEGGVHLSTILTGSSIVIRTFRGFSGTINLKQLFYYINGPWDKFIRVDMILNYIFRLGLRGNVLIEA